MPVVMTEIRPMWHQTTNNQSISIHTVCKSQAKRCHAWSIFFFTSLSVDSRQVPARALRCYVGVYLDFIVYLKRYKAHLMCVIHVSV